MNAGDKVTIVSNLYGEAGKTGVIQNVYPSGEFGLMVEVNTGSPSAHTYMAEDVVMDKLNVREAVDFESHGFIENKPIIASKDDAYRRKTITDEIIELWRAEINSTDTSGLSTEHKAAYDSAIKALEVVIAYELVVVCEK
jgi:hypothetical protein